MQTVLPVLFKSLDRAAPQVLINDVYNDLTWGKFKYTNPQDRPQDETDWYNFLTESNEHINDFICWWRQFGLNYKVFDKDLQSLTKVSTVG